MTRLSIDITQEQHQRLKVIAVLNNMSIKDYVIEQTLGKDQGDDNIKTLADHLKPRLARAKRGDALPYAMDDIIIST